MSLKEKILTELILSKGEYCSGGQLAEKFGVSRTAIWKAIDQLKAQGCEIDAITNKGYLLKKIPDIYNQTYMQMLLEGTNWQVQHYEELDSTNRLAKELASQGAPDGTVVTADVQTAGRGRMGKSFHSPTGGLYMSVVIHPDLQLSAMMSITACTATAVHEALKKFGIETQIKWVNDLFLNHKKICGILSEGSFNAEMLKMDYLIIGIGINLHPDPHLPEELKPIVTDIETETGKHINKCELTAEILKQMRKYFLEIFDRTYLEVYTENSCTLGHRVRTDTGLEGIAESFTEEAGLCIRLDDGAEMLLNTGSAQIID
ncbi:MAG: biotin--[acetyl-CoA-carboxylase] ligase [Ruminococcus sp.]|nr:biotin--[acetyl-CoA-carboxylase] ligase [Ruminococcus sp.]